MKAFEVNFDGLVGPTHNYAGLSYGNIASMSHKAAISNPREAALQGLIKAKALADMGFHQALLAPQERPDIGVLRKIGFYGSDQDVLKCAHKQAPELLAACSSASSMWTANAATICPSADSDDHKVHFTAANLNDKFHRAIEHETTTRTLQAIFKNETHFIHHPALPSTATLGDEGAANHTRFCREYGDAGLHLFIFGRVALNEETSIPKRFPARQTKEASESIARLHKIPAERMIFAQQNPDCIDAGAFHNDVVAVGNQNTLFYHESAFLNSKTLVCELKRRFESLCGISFVDIEVSPKAVPLKDAVNSYLFNSQLVTVVPGKMALIAPTECQNTPSVHRYLNELLAGGKSPIQEVKYFDLRQSMHNGGGPACLRLRIVLTEKEIACANPHVFLNNQSFERLKKWIEKHYRDRLTSADLADPKLLQESRAALDELTQLMHLGSIYSFQRLTS